jgi:integrase
MQHFRLFQRNGIYYSEDIRTRKQKSLRTHSREEAYRLVFHKDEASRETQLRLQIAQTYLEGVDPKMSKRTWSEVMEELSRYGIQSTRDRASWASKSSDFDHLRNKTLVETTAEDFLTALRSKKPSVNHFLRRYHNLALGLGWLPKPILPNRFWPSIRHKVKRAISYEEHQRIVLREPNQEKRLFYELLWETGASQGDIALLSRADLDLDQNLIIIYRRKLANRDSTPAKIQIGEKLQRLLSALPQTGDLFPSLKSVRAGHRSCDFKRRCKWLGIGGVSLHSYRYAWAERARKVGMPERYAQTVLGHSSKAVHRAYAKGADLHVPSLEDYEKNFRNKIIPMNIPNPDKKIMIN